MPSFALMMLMVHLDEDYEEATEDAEEDEDLAAISVIDVCPE